ncbi:MAG TPA: hypothetical protein VFN10_18085 [Thermoanaerobaculia bacterium]|nr:hypothetical protein [Thermoanaerobaculia bacterium]
MRDSPEPPRHRGTRETALRVKDDAEGRETYGRGLTLWRSG